MNKPCFITGTGLITVQGLDVASNWQNLLAGRVLHRTGVVALQRDSVLSRVSQLAVHAARHALKAADQPRLDDDRTALFVGTSKGPIEDWIEQLDGHLPPDVRLGVAQVAADVASAIGHTGGPRLTYAGACASGLHALIRARDAIRHGECDSALVVAAEASTHALFVANFARLGVMADPTEGCRPFDKRRHGFLLAEAAAAVWLTNRPSIGAVQIHDGMAIADATHITGIDPQGRSLRYLIHHIAGPQIHLVHTHGTGTVMNDAVELQAISQTLGSQLPILYSHKHAIGHTQGAAGLIGVVLNVEMHRRQTILANGNSPNPELVNRAVFPDMAMEQSVQSSLVIAAGFGGTIAGVRLSVNEAT